MKRVQMKKPSEKLLELSAALYQPAVGGTAVLPSDAGAGEGAVWLSLLGRGRGRRRRLTCFKVRYVEEVTTTGSSSLPVHKDQSVQSGEPAHNSERSLI